ncbi:MAG: SPOR domain-containing protein [Chromatiales bacterium]|nr:SPOR domain-containing protein [Chromatiales bacterium]
MSENRDGDEPLLPDDADRKIEELMAALREEEQGGDDSAGPASDDGHEFDIDEEFLSEGEGDFVDLEAEQLDHSADKLVLDESDHVEDELLEKLTASVTPSEEELKAQKARETREREVAARQMAEANALARARLDELEEKLAAVEAKPLPTLNNGQRQGGFPGWLSAFLALVAVTVSGAALWFNLNSPLQTTPPVATVSPVKGAEDLQGLRSDLASLRKRLAEVEKQAEMGSDEAVATMNRMQAMLNRIENRIIESSNIAQSLVPVVAEANARPQSSPAVAESQKSAAIRQPVVAQAKPVAQPTAGVTPAKPAKQVVKPDASRVKPAPGVTPVKPKAAKPVAALPIEGKVFIEGWAVNLRSFYRRADAEILTRIYQEEGIDAQIREVPKGKATWYRVRVMGFEDKGAAEAFIKGLSEEQGRDMAWPSHYAGYVDD